mgnify:FL=1
MRKPTRKLAKTARVAASAMMATGLMFSTSLGTARAADSQVSEQTVLLDVQPNASDRLTMDISATNGTFEIDGSQPRLIDANGQVSRVFKTGVVILPDGQEAEVTYALASDTKLEAHVRPTRGFDRDCFGDALILGGTVAASLIAAPETLGASVAAGAVVAGSEWNALNSCFGK